MLHQRNDRQHNDGHYNVFAEFQRQIAKPAKLVNGKLVVCSIRKKQNHVVGKPHVARRARKVLRDHIHRNKKYPELELVWDLVPFDFPHLPRISSGGALDREVSNDE